MHEEKMGTNSTHLNITDETIPEVNLPFGLILEFAIFLILAENLLILLTMRLYKKLKVVDLLVLSLAGSDFVNALLPLQILNVKSHFVISPWPRWLCGMFIATTYTLRIASLSTISLMSIEKAVLLFQPLKYYTQLTVSLMRKLIIAAWVSSAIVAVLPAALRSNQKENEDVYCRYQPYHFGMEFGLTVEVMGMLHFLIVLGSYVAMVVSSKGFRRRQKSMMQSQRKGRQDRAVSGKKGRAETQGMLQARQLCRVMGYVVVLYYATWLPFLIYNFHGLLTQTTKYNRKMGSIVGTFSLLAPILTPLVCIKMSSRYRKGVLILLGRTTRFGSKSEDRVTSNKELSTVKRRLKSVSATTLCESNSRASARWKRCSI